MRQMTLKEVIEKRQHKCDDDIRCSCNEFYKGYMVGWYWAYQDLLDILEQNNFDINQVVIKEINNG